MVKLSQYDLIKISGEKDAESIFIAKEIWPMFDKKTIQKKFERILDSKRSNKQTREN